MHMTKYLIYSVIYMIHQNSKPRKRKTKIVENSKKPAYGNCKQTLDTMNRPTTVQHIRDVISVVHTSRLSTEPSNIQFDARSIIMVKLSDRSREYGADVLQSVRFGGQSTGAKRI